MSLKEIIKRSALFHIYCEHKIWKDEKQRFIDEVSKSDIPSIAKERYYKTLKKYRISPSEYFYQYEFDRLSETERREFIMRSEMQKVYRELVEPSVRPYFFNKVLFLQTHANLIKRRWIVANHFTDKEELIDLITSVDTIVKPIEGSLGKGIYKIVSNKVDDPVLLAESLIRDSVLVEECITAIEEIQNFHPSSLNTIRVVTFSNGNKAEVIGAFIRFGCHGSIVDNAHAGGVFATIDIDTGKVISNGLDTDGIEYEYHPDSQKSIKGFAIPQWSIVKETCLQATSIVPGLKFAGWDCVVLPDGQVDIIEGNHGPDVDVMQSPLKIGIRKTIADKLKEFFDYNLR